MEAGVTKVIRVQAIRHDRAKEHGAYARPEGCIRRSSITRASMTGDI